MSLLLPERLDYPDQHIEADNRLFFYLGLLDEKYGSDAFYVHLLRDPEKVALSYSQRWYIEMSLGRGWEQTVLGRGRSRPEHERYLVARDAVASVNSGIRCFLKDKPRQMTIRLEDCPDAFAEFWDLVGLEGDRGAALAEWTVKHNASAPLNWRGRLVRKARRISRFDTSRS